MAEVVEESGELAGNITAFSANVAEESDVEALMPKAREAMGGLNVLVNNAGIFRDALLVKKDRNTGAIKKMSLGQWQAVIDVNLTGVFLCTQAAFKIMKDQQPHGGRIINNGSISATAPRPNSAAYTATKHAITGLTKATSLDGRKYDIACGQIDIGNAATNMTERMNDGVPQPDGSNMVEPRFDVEHVARAVVQMAELPLDTNVLFMTIMATKMPFVARG